MRGQLFNEFHSINNASAEEEDNSLGSANCMVVEAVEAVVGSILEVPFGSVDRDFGIACSTQDYCRFIR